METIYSKIIWNELGLKDFKIHDVEPKLVTDMVIDWVKTADFDKVEKVLFDLSFFESISYETYYDGPFYGINQRSKEKRDELYEGEYKCDVIVHHLNIFETVFHLLAKTNFSPNDLRFMAELLEVFQAREPKDRKYGWDHDLEEGTEI